VSQWFQSVIEQSGFKTITWSDGFNRSCNIYSLPNNAINHALFISTNPLTPFLFGKLVLMLVIAVALLSLPIFSIAATVVTNPSEFDHSVTGFPLTGKHKLLECEACHEGGLFEALPTLCNACHDNVTAEGVPIEHILTSLTCDTCHDTQGFIYTSKHNIDHSLFSAQPCISCHNGFNADGKGPYHITSSNECESCHNTFDWFRSSSVDHTQVVGSCYSCHNGVQATGRSNTHINTTVICEPCHAVSAGINWNIIPPMDHSQVIGNCSSCHDGVIATGKTPSPPHPVTALECNACHTTLAWKPALQ
jgi:hypothetical protein